MAAAEGLPIEVSVMDVDSDESVSNGTAAIREKSGGIDALEKDFGPKGIAQGH